MSFGYHGDDGNIYCGSPTPTFYTKKSFKEGDLIGVLIDFKLSILTFYLNYLTVLKVQLSSYVNQDLYPCVGISSPDALGTIQLLPEQLG